MGSRTLTKNLKAIEIKYFLTGRNIICSDEREVVRGNNAGFLTSVLLVKVTINNLFNNNIFDHASRKVQFVMADSFRSPEEHDERINDE